MNLSLCEISNAALSAAADLGFNCCVVRRLYRITDDKQDVQMWFGDRERPITPRVGDWGRATRLDVSCTRKPCTLITDSTELPQSADGVRAFVTERLLELQ